MNCHKEGSFDWIIDFENLKEFINQKYISNYNINNNVLVIGCGTSTLSHSLLSIGFTNIISIDNDQDCIDYMKNKHKDNHQLQWFYYDILNGYNDKLFNDSNINNIFKFGDYFDLVIDKGTLDAILVEGSVSEMLIEVRRLLKSNGNYFVCSLFNSNMIYDLLSIPLLEYSVDKYTSNKQINDHGHEQMTGNIIICNKLSNKSIKLNLLHSSEKLIMDNYFKLLNPLLNESHELKIRNRFNNEYISIEESYKILFSLDESLGYTFDLFLDDLKNFELSRYGFMNADEAVKFLRENQ